MTAAPTESAESAARRQYTALASRPGYLGFVLTVSLSRIATAMFMASGVLLVLARTGSAGLAGAVAAASVLPGALSGPLLGAWLDVARRRRVLIVADQLLSAVALITIAAVAGHAPNWTIPVLAVLLSITSPLSFGSFASALAEVAGEDLLDRASSIEATSLNLAVVVGPALAGALAGAAGPGVAIRAQAAVTVAVAAAIAANPVFEARTPARPPSLRSAVREGSRALIAHRMLRHISAASLLAGFSWGMMMVAFPLYAVQRLHAGAHAAGYLWAAVALGSIVGTFVLAGTPSARRVATSYAVLALSALMWSLAGSLLAGCALITLTGFIEGPAYSGTIALRQRHTPAALRGQVLNTLTSVSRGAAALGSAVGGLLHRPVVAFAAFTAVNLVAAATAARAGGGSPRR